MSKFPRRGPKTFSCRCAAQTFLGLNCDPVIFGAGSAPGERVDPNSSIRDSYRSSAFSDIEVSKHVIILSKVKCRNSLTYF